jgi:hypothetical protein
MTIPETAGNKITLHARLCYRKFSWWGTQFAFVGEPDEKSSHDVAAAYDDRPVLFTKSIQGVSAKEEKIPDVPIVTVAEDEVTLPVVAHNIPAAQPKTLVLKKEWQRWNDYGIGLFLQGDLKAAAAAFQKVTEADPANPDGWVNIGRCAVPAPSSKKRWHFLRTWPVRIISMLAFCVQMEITRAPQPACESS